MVCPVCGGAPVESVVYDYLTCTKCRELLSPGELVRRKTRRTRVRYARANGHTKHYGTKKETS